MPTNQKHHEKSASPQSSSTKTQPNASSWTEVASSMANMKETFGFTPTFADSLVDSSKPGAWAEAKSLRFNNHTALDMKTKGLIALGISAQIPCERIGYFEQEATKADGATRQEQLEAVLMAALTRHWSTVLNGSRMDKVEFQKEVEKVMTFVRKMMEESHGHVPPESAFLYTPTTASEAYEDIERTLGMVPKFFKFFPREGIAGAWSEFKGLQLNPHTALSGTQKELIGLAVAAQIPCEYCLIFHNQAALLNGATQRDMQEAIGLAALTRHWSTVFHGPEMDQATFVKDADHMVKGVAKHRLQ